MRRTQFVKRDLGLLILDQFYDTQIVLMTYKYDLTYFFHAIVETHGTHIYYSIHYLFSKIIRLIAMIAGL